MRDFIAADKLERGIRIWQERRWDADFHERVYRQYRDVKTIDIRVWKQVLDELGAWRANHPLSLAELYERGRVHLPRVNHEYQALLAAHGQRKPDLLEVEWTNLEPFFEACREIKGVASPVFAAKMCHFLLPGCFFVIDNAVIGVNEPYCQYWQRLRRAWQDYPDKAGIIAHFRAEVALQDPDRYPFATKIMEICLMGASE